MIKSFLSLFLIPVHVKMSSNTETLQFDIPALCKAGVVVNEGPDFRVEVQMVPVPEPGEYSYTNRPLL